MQKQELKARVDAQMDEGKRSLDVMKAKAEASTGDVKVKHAETVAGLQKQYDELKIKAAGAWDSADDTWDDVSKDIAKGWDDWTDRAAKSWDDHKK